MAMAMAAPLAVATAGYTAFLFAQAEGRDYWQSPLLLPHLIAQSVVAGAGALLIAGALLDAGRDDMRLLAAILGIGVGASTALIAMEFGVPHVNAHVRRTVELITGGPYRSVFYGGVLLIGALVPLALVAAVFAGDGERWLGPLAAIAALAGLWVYERVWVSAGQDVPLS
jgi:Ni/Fe-hydrogenase subunit HybB-like protein